MRRRRLVFLAVLLIGSVVLGVVYGGVTAAAGDPDVLYTWWGTALRALVAVGVCLGAAGFVDRRLARREAAPALGRPSGRE